MTDTILVVGAVLPSEKNANATAVELFGAATYPLVLEFTSQVPFRLSLPEARLKLEPFEKIRLTVTDFSRLQRAVTSLVQIAELNKLARIVTISPLSAAPPKPVMVEVPSVEPSEVVPVDDEPATEEDTEAKKPQPKAVKAKE